MNRGKKVDRHQSGAALTLPAGENPLRFLTEKGIVQSGKPLRLHLGCGEIHLHGYVNIDYPPSEHTVQMTPAADVYADLVPLNFPPQSVDEVRLHHVFEHFDRPTALALLCNWHQWLKAGGRLVIETPDFEASARMVLSSELPYSQRQAVLRHIFGSHEAYWAVHWDGWYADKYQHVLTALGYTGLDFEKSRWQMLENITVRARKNCPLPAHALRQAAYSILRASMVDRSASEEKLWEHWRKQFEARLIVDEAELLTPQVSIFMPVYNRERYLQAALDSLLNQAWGDFELILADDGSSDRSLEIAYEAARRDPRVRVLPLPHQGEVAARNAAVQAAHPAARYLMNHDSDDISLPGKLEKLVAYLEAHPEVAIVGCQAEYFDDEGRSLGRLALACEPERIRSTFGKENAMVNSAALIRREVFERVGLYRPEFQSVDDYDFFARALLAGFQLANLPENLHRIRVHRVSVGSTEARKQALRGALVRAYYELDRLAPETPPWERLARWVSLHLRVWRTWLLFKQEQFQRKLFHRWGRVR